MSQEHPPQLHVPVMLDQVVRLLAPKAGESYLDLTAGYGGHAQAVLDVTRQYNQAVLVDRDEYAIKHLSPFAEKGAQVMHTDFVTATQQLTNEGRQFDMVLIDLGVSSPQLDEEERGFSFSRPGPLDMRMDQAQAVSAADIVNSASASELVRIITSYGEEPLGFARRIAKAIMAARPLRTTDQLATVILQAHHGAWKKIHPATRTFQALRIAVNDELHQIETVLPLLPTLLNPGGRVAVISFHSLEDRLVKRFFKEQFELGLEAELSPVTKKPLAGKLYDVHNPRSRSAKLRVAVKK